MFSFIILLFRNVRAGDVGACSREPQPKEKCEMSPKLTFRKKLQSKELIRTNCCLKEEQFEQNKPSIVSVESVQSSKIKNDFQYYTVFLNSQFLCILNFLVPRGKVPFEMSNKISSVLKMKVEDQLLHVLVKLRFNLQFYHLAGNSFNLSP